MLGAKVQFPTTSKESVEKVEKMQKGYGVICNFLLKSDSNQFYRKSLPRYTTTIIIIHYAFFLWMYTFCLRPLYSPNF